MDVLIDAYSGNGPGAAHGLETEDLDVTVVAWPAGSGIEPHTNQEVDVVSIVLSGKGRAIVDGAHHDLRPGSIVVIAKGAERSILSLSSDFRYVNIHKRRRKLMPKLQKRAKTHRP